MQLEAKPQTFSAQADPARYLACDLGAESGRLMLGTLEANRLEMEEVTRFPNVPLNAGGALHWNIDALFEQFESGLREAARQGLEISSISTDSWGLDYLLIDRNGSFLRPAFHYRDGRTARGVERVLSLLTREEIFSETGIQFMPINTLFQLAAEDPARLREAVSLVSIADGFNYWLSGKATIEESMASTFQLYNPRTRAWSDRLARAIGLPSSILPTVVRPGTRLGPVRQPRLEGSGLEGVEVIAGCSHDTAAAVAAIPGQGSNWAYISSGTWSLMGVELAHPILTDQCRELNFTNEIGWGGLIRLLKNIVGLWLLQECRREWEKEDSSLDYAALMRMAEEAPAFVSLIDAADPRFIAPGGMPEKIAAYCRETGQPEPRTPAACTRCVLESLALIYRRTLEELERVLGTTLERVHIVGGGSRNALLCQFTADALERPVVSGPAEATAVGNVLIQAITLGHLPSLAAARQVVQESFPLREYRPGPSQNWRKAADRLKAMAWPAGKGARS